MKIKFGQKVNFVKASTIRFGIFNTEYNDFIQPTFSGLPVDRREDYIFPKIKKGVVIGKKKLIEKTLFDIPDEGGYFNIKEHYYKEFYIIAWGMNRKSYVRLEDIIII